MTGKPAPVPALVTRSIDAGQGQATQQGTGMYPEIAQIAVTDPAGFEAAAAGPHFPAAQGCHVQFLHRMAGTPGVHHPVVKQERIEDHRLTFRRSDGFQA